MKVAPVDIASGVFGLFVVIGLLGVLFHRVGLIHFGKNGNGKFSQKECNARHSRIDLCIQHLEEAADNHEKRLGKGDDRFDQIMERLASIDTNIAVIADRAERRREEYKK